MKEIWNRIKEELTPEKIAIRLIMSWLLTTLLFFVKSNETFLGAVYASKINTGMYICFIILFFVFFYALGMFKTFEWIETYGPLILATLYGFMTLQVNKNLTYIIAVMVVLTLTIIHAMNNSKKFLEIQKTRSVILIYSIFGILYMLIAGTVTVLRYKTYSSPAFDFGIWTQMFENMRKGFVPVTTVERDYLMSHFAVHFSPIYYLYLPFYMIFPSPVTLQVLQAITLASGLVPVYLLCKKKELSKSATAAFAIIYALYPALATGCYYDLHENCFLTPLLLWLFYFIEADDFKGICIFSILTMLVKEDAPVYVACIGLYVMLGKQKYTKGITVMGGAIVYFLVVSLLMKKYGLGIMSNRYNNYMVTGSGSLFDVIKNFMVNPAYVLSECFSADRLEYIVYMLLPLGFLPIATKKISEYILLIPMLLINLATDYVYQHSIFFQYVFGVAGILIYLAIINYSQMQEKGRRFMCSVAICAAVVVMPITSLSKMQYIDKYKNNKEKYRMLDEMLEDIPKDASVSASTFFIPHLAEHEVLHEYPYMYDNSIMTDYLIIDLRGSGISETDLYNLESKGYVTVEKVEGLYLKMELGTE